MKRVLEVCAIAIVVITSAATVVIGQSRPDIPQQRGISVEMPIAPHAIAMPDADEEDAFVVVVNEIGSLYLGAEPTDPTALAAAAKSRSPVYLKADARSSCENVLRAMDALRSAGVRSVTLLSTVAREPRSGPPQVPQGMVVSILAASSGTPILVQISGSNPELPLVTIDNQQVPWTSLQTELGRRVQTDHKQVSVAAAGSLPFADMVRVVDAAAATGARVYIAN